MPAVKSRSRLDYLQWRCNISTVIVRQHYLDRVKRALGRNPVVALLGPRQCGKTTLARQMIPAGHPQYFDLEDPVVGRLMENPMTALQGLRGLVVIDEAQRQPGRFPVLRITNLAGLSGTLLFTNLVSPDTNNFWRIRSLP
jgi:predicted AAA+ superfamily ATPase